MRDKVHRTRDGAYRPRGTGPFSHHRQQKTTAMKTATSRRQAYRPIEPSWLTLGQACLLIMMVVLVQI
ncbi:MAG: hypothetical protein KA791_07695 [Flavobacteriales bacterium]|nr:hypothetical protein [Flavobacteriales bacterium]